MSSRLHLTALVGYTEHDILLFQRVNWTENVVDFNIIKLSSELTKAVIRYVFHHSCSEEFIRDTITKTLINNVEIGARLTFCMESDLRIITFFNIISKQFLLNEEILQKYGGFNLLMYKLETYAQS